MGVLSGLFERMAATDNAEHDVKCWLWLVALKDGHTVQMTFAPVGGLADARKLAERRYGAAVVRVVPVRSADRLLNTGEVGRALMGLGLGSVPVPPMTSERWLDRVAWLLDCTREQLLSSGVVSLEDAASCSDVAPYLAADAIRASGWTPSNPAQSGQSVVRADDAIAPGWIAVYDEYLRHVKACPSCTAHRLRTPVHCDTGGAIRARYEFLFYQADEHVSRQQPD